MTVQGYASSTSVVAGGTLALHLSANPAGKSKVFVQRLGVNPAPVLWCTPSLSTRTVPVDGYLPPGYGWPVTTGIPVIPSGWASGLYRLTDIAGTFILDFVVRPLTPGGTSKRLLLADFITPEAYNKNGGNSLHTGTPRNWRVSLNRPPYGPPLAPAPWSYDKLMLEWLYNAAHSYPVEVASNLDLHSTPTLLDPYDCVILAGRAESWSKEIFDGLEAFVTKGGNLVSLSGNTGFRQVRFQDSNRSLFGYLNSLTDTNPDLGLQTVAFGQTPVHRPQNRVLGVGWTHGGADGGGTAQPYTIQFPGHWAFAGVTGSVTGVAAGSFVDAAPFTTEPTPTPYPRVLRESDTALSTVVLASADLTTWPGKPGMATMALGTRGGMVFSGGSSDWLQHIADPALLQITKNVLTRMTTRRVFDWEQLGPTNGVVAMASVEDRLFCVSGNVLWVRHPVLANADWRQVGAATNMVHLAGARGLLFALDASNQLYYWRPLIEPPTWTPIGTGTTPAVPPTTITTMGSLGAMLYGTDAAGKMWCRAASTVVAAWLAVASIPQNAGVTKLCSYNGMLLAATSNNGLVRSNKDFVEESTAWVNVGSCSGAGGLAVVEQMLFMATSQNLLWWLDLRHPTMDLKA